MSKADGGHAFPHDERAQQNERAGMTMRQYYAAHAPEPPDVWRGGDRGLGDIIAWRWWYADAMIREGERS